MKFAVTIILLTGTLFSQPPDGNFRKPIVFKGVSVTVEQVGIDGYPLGMKGESTPLLRRHEGTFVKLKIESPSADLKPIAPDWDFNLTDDKGNSYAQQIYSGRVYPRGETYVPNKSLYPEKPVTQIVLFEKAVDAAEWFTLTISEGKDSLRIRLPIRTGDADRN